MARCGTGWCTGGCTRGNGWGGGTRVMGGGAVRRGVVVAPWYWSGWCLAVGYPLWWCLAVGYPTVLVSGCVSDCPGWRLWLSDCPGWRFCCHSGGLGDWGLDGLRNECHCGCGFGHRNKRRTIQDRPSRPKVLWSETKISKRVSTCDEFSCPNGFSRNCCVFRSWPLKPPLETPQNPVLPVLTINPIFPFLEVFMVKITDYLFKNPYSHTGLWSKTSKLSLPCWLAQGF